MNYPPPPARFRVRVSFFPGPVFSGPGSRTICFDYNYIFSLYLSLGSMLERLVLKNAADCTSQVSNGPLGPKLRLFWYNYIFSSYLSLGSMLQRLGLKNAADCTSQRVKRTSGARVMICLLSSKQANKLVTSRQANK